MSTPTVTPSKAKAWVATIGGLIISQLPLILQFMGHLPAPYGVIATSIGTILAAITGKVTHQAPYMPTGTVIVPSAPEAPPVNPYLT
jgi:hypothetical protein